MKQFYLLLIIGLLSSGVVFVSPRLWGVSDIFEMFLKRCNLWKSYILLAFFDLSIGFANIVWVGEGNVVILEHLLPCSIAILSAAILFYLSLQRQYPEYIPKHFKDFFRVLDFCTHNSFYVGVSCIVVAFIHFFAEGIIFL